MKSLLVDISLGAVYGIGSGLLIAAILYRPIEKRLNGYVTEQERKLWEELERNGIQ